MLVSTFELLVKKQLPPKSAIEETNSEQKDFILGLSRTVIQGYFLTLANPSDCALDLFVIYNLKSKFPNEMDFEKSLSFYNADGDPAKGSLCTNPCGKPVQPSKEIRYRKFSHTHRESCSNRYPILITLEPKGTALLVLQPNLTASPNLLSSGNLEARGYAEIHLASSSSPGETAEVLVTPEHRGTVFADNPDSKTTPVAIGEIAYSLPVQNGGLLTVSEQ